MPSSLRKVKSWATVGLLAGGLSLAACGDDEAPKSSNGGAATGGAAKDSVTVQIASFRFAPKEITLKTGGTIKWVNQDKAPHTATDKKDKADRVFDTQTLKLGEEGEVTIDKPGEYTYFCLFHPFMVAKVTVVDS